MAKNIIELNGKQYDAVSGAFVGHTNHASKAKPTAAKQARQVDSFVRQKPSVQAAKVESPSTTIHVTVADPVSAQASSRRQSSPAQHLAAHKPQHPQTLMRRAVRKPEVSVPAKLKAVSPTNTQSALAKPDTRFHKVAVSSVSPSRLARAQQVNQTDAIKRFSAAQPTQVPVAAAPVQQPITQQPTQTTQPTGQQRSQALFEQAMANSTSHQQTYNRKSRHGLSRAHVAILSSAFAIIFVAGFLMYRSIPSMNLSLASSKAGFRASMPGYQPPGFSLGHLTYGSGSVTINYHSNSDDRKFSVTEKTSTWDSSMLFADYVKTSNQPYQSYQIAGRTVYLYGDNNATWVDGGIWYVVNGDTALSSNQLLEMADSI